MFQEHLFRALYGTKFWAMKSQWENKVNVAEMKSCIRWVGIQDKIGLGMNPLLYYRESYTSIYHKKW